MTRLIHHTAVLVVCLLSFPILFAVRTNDDASSWQLVHIQSSVDPPPRALHTATKTDDDRILLYGGYDLLNCSVFGNVWLFDPAAATWSLPTLPTNTSGPAARYAHTSLISNGMLVVYGGATALLGEDCDIDTTGTSEMWLYDFTSRQWVLEQPKSTSPQERMGHIAVMKPDGQMLVYGGYSQHVLSEDMWQYSFQLKSWSQLSPSSIPPGRAFMAHVTTATGFIIYGGVGYGRQPADMWEFVYGGDTGKDSWHRLEIDSAPAASCYLSSCSYVGNMILYGGMVDAETASSELWAFQQYNQTWLLLNNTDSGPGAREASSLTNLNGQLYMFGGQDALRKPFNDMWMYNLRQCPNNCTGHGDCDLMSGVCLCTQSRFFGDDCGQVYCPMNCNYHGQCDFTTGTCYCSFFYSGLTCSGYNVPVFVVGGIILLVLLGVIAYLIHHCLRSERAKFPPLIDEQPAGFMSFPSYQETQSLQ